MDLVAGAGLAIGTFLVLAVGLGVAGFAVLFRRRGDASLRGSSGGLRALTRRSGSLLVKLDDDVRDAEAELGYAVAQFGEDRTRPFVSAVDEARGKLAEAFRLRQALDDSRPDTDRERREWTLQIIALCEQGEKLLSSQDNEFRRLRGLEVNAAGTLEDIRRRIRDADSRLDGATRQVDSLAESFAAHVLASVRGNPDRARTFLGLAQENADAAATGIRDTGVNAVSGRLADAAQAVRAADALLDAVDRRARELSEATAALANLKESTKEDLAEARAEAASAPDPDSGAGILRAIAAVESVKPSEPTDPIGDLDRLSDSIADLDLALAGSRNQAQRLSHARAAYEGTLVSARSQIAVARELVGRAGVDARTRLAESERQLAIAEAAADTDPVEALDAVRRAVTHARDADALARYDSTGGR